MKDIFWMGGKLATDVIERRSDLTQLDDGNFWAISISYEGDVVATSFRDVRDEEFPEASWSELQGKWRSSQTQAEYCSYVENIRKAVEEGSVYQVNACRILELESEQPLEGLFSKILAQHGAPYASFYRSRDLEIASASPELFLKREGSKVVTSPIKGTRPLASDSFGSKDMSENIMIVDLMRNDLGQICSKISTPQLLREEEHPGLVHLVSDVQGELLPHKKWAEILSPLLPPGSISGAPKRSAKRIIEEHESVRGPYCGVLGWVQGDQALLSVAIRIFWRNEGFLKFGTGAGITWSSNPTQEWRETELKASRLIPLAGGSL